MPPLSDAQLAVLMPALTREDRCIFPVTAKLKGGAVGNVAKSLLKRGLLEETHAADHAVVWRCAEDGAPLTLCVTDAGALAISGEFVDAGKLDEASVDPVVDQGRGIGQRKRGSAQEAVIALLKREEGATIAEMQEATGWLPHSVRGALSGVISKRLGHTIVSAKKERGRVYRIA